MILIAILLTFMAADVFITNAIINKGGKELNPVVRWFMDTFGAWWFLPKIFVTACAIAIFAYINLYTFGLIFANIVYAGVLAWNIKELCNGV
jgi:hypothetical protein